MDFDASETGFDVPKMDFDASENGPDTATTRFDAPSRRSCAPEPGLDAATGTREVSATGTGAPDRR